MPTKKKGSSTLDAHTEDQSTKTGSGQSQSTHASLQDAVETVKVQASEISDDVKAQIQNRADKAKDTVADNMADTAQALRAAANRSRDGSPQERTIGQIAESLADVSDAIRGKDLGEMVDGINQFARQNPPIFLGAAALLGFAASRFGKSSTSDNSQDRRSAADRSQQSNPPQSSVDRSEPTAALGDRNHTIVGGNHD